MMQTYYKYWGKAKKLEDGGWDYHLLPYHCLDVAAVGYYLADRLGLAEHIARKLGCEKIAVTPVITFFCAVHDIGKFSNGFQNQIPELVTALKGVSLNIAYQEKHWSLGYSFWREYADKVFEGDKYTIAYCLDAWFSASSGHHGRPPTFEINSYFNAKQFPVEEVIKFISDIKEIAGMPADINFLLKDEHLMKESSWLIAGLMVLADWIGSNSRWFFFQQTEQPLKEYWEQKALPQAQTAINESGILPVSAANKLSVTQMFEYKQATPLQTLAEQITISNNGNLFILEEITGAGKTEAAFILAHRLMTAGYADGLYFGLPTMATANAMHERVEQVYRKLFVDVSNPALVLAHSASRQYLALENSAEESVDGDEGENAQVDAKAWLYDNRKKALLAHVGVGTIDQALLAILPARHQSLRLLGLHRKVLIVDEVHAYESYTNKLLCTLLKFHAAQGGSAILLSATLPVCARKQFLAAFSEGKDMMYDSRAVLNVGYPIVTGITGTDFSENAVESPVELHREVKVELVYREEDVIAKIKALVEAGNNICWVRNTVFDAQAAYEVVSKHLNAERIVLFHARYTLGDRLLIEKQIIEQFGKNSNSVTRSGKVVIATQVVEQSLDIDFDCMITDLAPIDLIIQRAGRLCRHARDERGNRIDEKDKRGVPVLIVFAPPFVGEPKANWYKEVFRKAGGVYEHHGQLWLTARWLAKHKKFRMPQDARDMIEFVYGENMQGDIPESLQRQEDKAGGNDRAAAGVGRFQALKLTSGYMPDSLKWLDDEKAPTRLGDIRTTVRMARWNGDTLVPFFDNDWKLSEVLVARYWIAMESDDDRKAIDTAKALMPDKGKFCVVVPMVEKDGVFYGTAKNTTGNNIAVFYDTKRGLRVQEQGETDESD
ncbi:MAG: CRISPR-associated helicase Cas3' [Candidatus Omnitrophica bacterium]|nr:CRISPR-associated helicase Cas3' [Candidatus Omnitrophota bacterium]